MDKNLRDQQAGFRRERSCIDQIATLRMIIEQSIEWNSSLYVNFIDFEKAFDSLDREILWKLLDHYGIPTKLITLIKKYVYWHEKKENKCIQCSKIIIFFNK